MSKLTKANLESIRFASRDITRESLTRLHVRDGFTEATDGHRLIRVPAEANGHGNPSGLIDQETVKKALKILPKDGEAIYDGENLAVADAVFPAGEAKESEYPKTDGVWPDLKHGEYIRIGFNAEYLAEISAFMKKHGDDSSCHVMEIYVAKPTQPAVLVSGDIQAILMPVRFGEESKDLRS